MPKIIENLEERLMEEARLQAEKNGYSAVTVRSVAEACGVGVGTVYNYYPSKDALLAAFLLKDWKDCIVRMTQAGEAAASPEEGLQAVWLELRAYLEEHAYIFHDAGAVSGFGSSVGKYHSLLRQQLSKPLRPFCPDDFTAQFVSEAMLTWAAEGMSFADLCPVLKKLL